MCHVLEPVSKLSVYEVIALDICSYRSTWLRDG